MDSKNQKPLIGGQAVIDGVMMKSPRYMAIAVRRPDKTIGVHSERVRLKEDRHPIENWPFIRGITVLAETFVLGYKALTYSTNVSLGEEENLGWKETLLTFVLAIGFALFVFKFIPLFVATFLASRIPVITENYLLFNLIDGFLKISLFLLYILVIGRIADIREVFGYHGAEHKTVNCFEKGNPLDVENVRGFTLIHPRCGTTFVIVVLLFSILVYLFIPSSLSLGGKYLWRLALLPFIAGASYELIKIGVRFWDLKVVRAVMSPLLVVQRLTTRPPRDDQLEVGIAALNAVLELETAAD